MRNNKIIISLFVILLFWELSGCSSSLPEIKTVPKISEGIYKNDIRINVNEIYAWVNLMPGAKTRFHITGSIDLLESSGYNLKNVQIKKINILQSNNVIYQITPKVEEEMKKNKKVFLFSTMRGLNYTTILDKEKPIEVQLEFSDSASDFKYLISNVKIDEAH